MDIQTQSDKLRLCIFSGDITRPGGTERVAAFLADGLAASPRFDVSLVSLTESSDTPAFPVNDGIPRFTLSEKWVQPGPGYLRVIRRLLRLIRREKFSVIIDVDTVLDLLSVPCKWLTGIRVVSWEHFHYTELLGTSYRSLCRKITCRFSDCIVPLTERDAGVWRSSGHPSCPVIPIPNPANYLPPCAPPARRGKIILSAGGLVPIKGFEDVIQAARQVIPRFPDWKFLIVGDGPEKEHLLRLIRQYHLEDNVILKGYSNDMPSLYLQSSIYLLTSRSEGLPMVLLEAKYYRLPTISYDIENGPSEILLDGTNGYLVPPGRTDLLAEKLCALIEDDALRQSFSEHAWDNIDKFDKDAILNRWTDLLLNLSA